MEMQHISVVCYLYIIHMERHSSCHGEDTPTLMWDKNEKGSEMGKNGRKPCTGRFVLIIWPCCDLMRGKFMGFAMENAR